jgi:hypothetical protein
MRSLLLALVACLSISTARAADPTRLGVIVDDEVGGSATAGVFSSNFTTLKNTAGTRSSALRVSVAVTGASSALNLVVIKGGISTAIPLRGGEQLTSAAGLYTITVGVTQGIHSDAGVLSALTYNFAFVTTTRVGFMLVEEVASDVPLAVSGVPAASGGGGGFANPATEDLDMGAFNVTNVDTIEGQAGNLTVQGLGGGPGQSGRSATFAGGWGDDGTTSGGYISAQPGTTTNGGDLGLEGGDGSGTGVGAEIMLNAGETNTDGSIVMQTNDTDRITVAADGLVTITGAINGTGGFASLTMTDGAARAITGPTSGHNFFIQGGSVNNYVELRSQDSSGAIRVQNQTGSNPGVTITGAIDLSGSRNLTWTVLPAAAGITPIDSGTPAGSGFATTTAGVGVQCFNASSKEACDWFVEVPRTYNGGTLTVDIEWISRADGGGAGGATTGDVVWIVQVQDCTDGSLDLDSSSFDSAVAGTATTTSGTSGVLNRTTVTLTQAQADDIAAGDLSVWRIARDADHVPDTMTGDAGIVAVTIRETPSP